AHVFVGGRGVESTKRTGSDELGIERDAFIREPAKRDDQIIDTLAGILARDAGNEWRIARLTGRWRRVVKRVGGRIRRAAYREAVAVGVAQNSLDRFVVDEY